MPTDLLSSFTDALARHEVTWTTATPTDLAGTINDLIREPAVAAPGRDPDYSLPPSVSISPTPRELETANTGITQARYGIAEYGTLVLPSLPGGDEPVSLFPPFHLAILPDHRLLPDIPTAISRISQDIASGIDSMVFATGPSATADMGELVQGVHGPESVHVVIVNEQ